MRKARTDQALTDDGRPEGQMSLWTEAPIDEDPAYLSTQLITCIGNKRALLGHIGLAVERVKRRLGKDRLRILDAFSGSGVVSRYLKAHASCLVSNDLEDYAAVISRCYLRNRSAVNLAALADLVAELNQRVATANCPSGFIQDLYAPKDETRIAKEDRVFYTRDNARRLDAYRGLIEEAPSAMRDLLLGPLLSEASIHANTAGVFKGFYKNRHTGIGQFGGSGSDALFRIKGQISLDIPVLSRFECECEVMQEDANRAARLVGGFDFAYIDPPYNQHPYGSNYFMLNLLVSNRRPTHISKNSGIPADWRRSGYNSRQKAAPLLRDLLQVVDAKFLLISFNNEGFVSPETMRAMLDEIGMVEVIEAPYNAFRGSRNFNTRSLHVTEFLFLVERR